MKKVATPFLPEDHSSAESRVPACGGNAVSCPWCKHSFPETEFKALKIKRKKQPGTSAEVSGGQGKENQGRLQSIAASILMTILYAARMARFDLLRATCKLACYTTK